MHGCSFVRELSGTLTVGSKTTQLVAGLFLDYQLDVDIVSHRYRVRINALHHTPSAIASGNSQHFTTRKRKTDPEFWHNAPA
jgi:hypothetical protein